MRFLRALPVFALTLAFAIGACAQQGEEGGEDLTPADTAQMEDGAMDDGMDDGAMDDGMDDGAMDEGGEMGEEGMEDGGEMMEGAEDEMANPCAGDEMDHDGEMANPCGGQ